MKKVLSLALAVIMALTLVACSSPSAPPAADKKTYHIGYSVATFTQALNAQTAVLFEAACKERGYEFTVTDGEMDTTKQLEDIDAIIKKGVDALLILPVDGVAVAPGIEAAHAAGIPTFLVLRDAPNSKDLYTQFSGTDDIELGTIAGNWIAEATGGEGTIVYITGTPGISTAENRTKGFHSVVDNHPGLTVIEQAGNYNRALAMEVFEAILKANSDIKAVWCANDEMAGGVCQAIDAAKREGILVGGANLQKDAFERLLSGEQAIDITTPPQMVIAALDSAIAVLEGGTVDKVHYYPLDLVTKENASQFESQIY